MPKKVSIEDPDVFFRRGKPSSSYDYSFVLDGECYECEPGKDFSGKGEAFISGMKRWLFENHRRGLRTRRTDKGAIICQSFELTQQEIKLREENAERMRVRAAMKRGSL